MSIPRRRLSPEEQKKREEYVMRRRAAGVSVHQIAKEIAWDKKAIQRFVKQQESRGDDAS
jgi:hypothetical protein